jgi:predicted glycosyltransferase involved in capsule biosynthesis
VLIGVRNRADHRIVNALRSLREQVYPWGRVTTLVVDYGSDVSEAKALSEACARHGATLLRVDSGGAWSRGRCLNVGIRHVQTKYLMTSDADIVLSPHYLADAVAAIRGDPLSVVCGAMLDLPEASLDETRRAGRGEATLDLAAWRSRCEPRFGWKFHPSIAVTLTAYYRAIRGYDEFYEGWGREDDDLMSRFGSLGLRPTQIPKRSFYLHQWHSKFEGLGGDVRERVIGRNADYFSRTHTILRNAATWGRTGDSGP